VTGFNAPLSRLWEAMGSKDVFETTLSDSSTKSSLQYAFYGRIIYPKNELKSSFGGEE
jgi:hypothetical protein